MKSQEIAYLGGGCFWCLEAVFQRVTGVLSVRSGYSGGSLENPSYEEVSSGGTNHAEVVEITFDNTLISFENILDIFFEIHDPTTLNRQGADVGTQYRSVIFANSPDQLLQSLKKIAELNSSGKFHSPIITQVTKLEKFYSAENYHQNFYNNNPDYAYCRIVIDPKLKKLIDINKNQDII
jgi:peptide-methionine (S)-S-oxide reductase